MITLLEGRSGSGKTFRIYERFAEAVKSGEKKLLYLIPEQSSFECETQLLRLLGPKDARLVRVMSFTRLYYMVMSETNAEMKNAIDDSIRSIIMSYTLEDIAEELSLYEKQANKPQFAQLASSAVKEMKQCGVLPETLRDKAGETDSGELRKKLRELAFIYDAYNANVEQSGVDPYDNDIRLEQRIRETNFFDGYIIAVDDFSGFTAQQHKILELMMEQSKEIYFSLCKDINDGDELFYTVDRTKKRLKRSAKKLGTDCRSDTSFCKNRRTNSETLMFIEENIYRPEQEEAPEDLPDDVTVFEASDVYEECEYIAGRINDLALSGKCRYRDIAVVFRKSDRYDGIIDDVFDKCGVPYFMSKSEPVEAKPLILLITAALDWVMSPNDEEKLMTAVKSGMLGVSGYSAAQLENYIYVWGLRGKSFFAPFTAHPRGYVQNFTEDDTRVLSELNETREVIAKPFSMLLERLGGDSFESHEISAALYDFLITGGVDTLIKNRAIRSEEFSSEEVRLWDMLVEMFDKLHAALGSRRLTVKRYAELFRMMIRSSSLSDIPQTLDQVVVGKADSMRFSKPYAVFVVGAVDGEFPHIPVPDGVFNDAERKDLISLGLPLYDAVSDLFRQEKFLVYNAVSAPSDKLCVSYPKSGLSGGVCEPSSIVDQIMKLLPKLKVCRASGMGKLERINGERSAFELYARTHSDNDAFTKALEQYLKESDEYAERLPLLGADIKNISAKLTKNGAAAAVFGRNKYLSASQIEKFYECRFKYFCEYGIAIRDRRKAQLDSLIYGDLLHYIMEHVIIEYRKRDYEPFTDKELGQLLDELLEAFMEDELGGKSGKSERFKLLYYRSRRRVWKVLSNMFDELAHTSFRPEDAELKIGSGGIGTYTVTSTNGNRIDINGKIDRVDLMKLGDKSAVRIIDYKSGGKKFSLDEAVNGLNLQMLIYLSAVAENGGERYKDTLEPAALFYMKTDSGAVSVDDVGADKAELAKLAETKKNSELKMKGIFLDSEAVSEGLDESYIDTPDKSRISKEKLAALFICVKNKIIAMSDELDDGRIEAVPTRKDSQFGVCDWCDFKDLCRREKDDAENTVEKDSSKAVLEEIENEMNGEGGAGNE